MWVGADASVLAKTIMPCHASPPLTQHAQHAFTMQRGKLAVITCDLARVSLAREGMRYAGVGCGRGAQPHCADDARELSAQETRGLPY